MTQVHHFLLGDDIHVHVQVHLLLTVVSKCDMDVIPTLQVAVHQHALSDKGTEPTDTHANPSNFQLISRLSIGDHAVVTGPVL